MFNTSNFVIPPPDAPAELVQEFEELMEKSIQLFCQVLGGIVCLTIVLMELTFYLFFPEQHSFWLSLFNLLGLPAFFLLFIYPYYPTLRLSILVFVAMAVQTVQSFFISQTLQEPIGVLISTLALNTGIGFLPTKTRWMFYTSLAIWGVYVVDGWVNNRFLAPAIIDIFAFIVVTTCCGFGFFLHLINRRQRWDNFFKQKQIAGLNEQLQTYTSDLEESNQELDKFARTVAHDLKNPLGSILGYTEMLMEDAPAMEAVGLVEDLRRIHTTGRKAIAIINELLLLAAVRKEHIDRQPIQMQIIVEQALERLAFMVQEQRPEIIWPESWPVAVGYAPWVEEVWSNYLSNALKYGGRPPKIILRAYELPDGYVRFEVQDNGRGITPAQQATLFDEFTRFDQIRAEGHGLGLSIAARIIHKLDGQVGVESSVGQGSCFYFTMPSWAESLKRPAGSTHSITTP
jgi:signal transduction histidine kinase